MSLTDEDVKRIEEVMEMKIAPLRDDVSGLDGNVGKLISAIDKLLKKLTDYTDEFDILKAEVRSLKAVVKEKLGVDIDTLR